MIDRTIQLASFAAGIVSRDASLELVHGGSLSTVVFRYVPERKGIDQDELNAAIRQRLFDRGSAVIGHTRVRGRQCLKFTFMNPSVSEGQIEELVGMVTKCGRQMEKELS
jgi:L-2,4-diaminobutyrate decarboxylase